MEERLNERTCEDSAWRVLEVGLSAHTSTLVGARGTMGSIEVARLSVDSICPNRDTSMPCLACRICL